MVGSLLGDTGGKRQTAQAPVDDQPAVQPIKRIFREEDDERTHDSLDANKLGYSSGAPPSGMDNTGSNAQQPAFTVGRSGNLNEGQGNAGKPSALGKAASKPRAGPVPVYLRGEEDEEFHSSDDETPDGTSWGPERVCPGT